MANKYFRQALIPTAATETTMYTVPEANSAIIRSLRVTNTTGTASDITVSVYVNGIGTGNVLQKTRPVGPYSTFDVFNGIPSIMEATDVLKVLSSGSDIHFYLSYLEVDRN